jgi:hypothetical protein
MLKRAKIHLLFPEPGQKEVNIFLMQPSQILKKTEDFKNSAYKHGLLA